MAFYNLNSVSGFSRPHQYRLLGDEAFPGQGKSRDEELTKLKRELAKVKQERDFLRDAAVFFAKESK